MELYKLSMPDRLDFGLSKKNPVSDINDKDWTKYDGIFVSKRMATGLKASATRKKNKQKKFKDYNIYFVICDVIYSDIENMCKKEIRSIYNRRAYDNGGKERQTVYYKNTEKGRASQRKSARNHSKTEKGRASQRKGMSKYFKTEKGKQAMKKVSAKRDRNLGWIPLMNNPFPCDVEWHHVLNNFHAIDANNPWNKWFVIPLPKITHRFVGGTTSDLGHWRYTEEWIRKLYCIDINELLNGKKK